MSSIFGDAPIATLTTQQVRLDLQKVGATIASTAEVSMFLEEGLHRRLVTKLEAYVLSEKLVGDTYKTTVTKDATLTALDREPASWFQHFKRDHLPTVARWRPVKYRLTTREVTGPVTVPVEVTFERYATYPHANIAIPDSRLGAPVTFERVVVSR